MLLKLIGMSALLIALDGGAVLSQVPEATSLSGKPLACGPPARAGRPPTHGATGCGAAAAALRAAAWPRGAYAGEPSSVGAASGLGRRLAYLGRFRDAIGAYTRGIAR